MSQNSLIQVRIDEQTKRDADALFSDLGLDTPTAIRMFLRQAVKRHGLPFEVSQHVPNAETIAAMQEAETISHDPTAKTYANFAEILAEVETDGNE